VRIRRIAVAGLLALLAGAVPLAQRRGGAAPPAGAQRGRQGGRGQPPARGRGPQQPQQPTVFRAQTDLVPVYVVAVDAEGQPVHGLTRDDFTLADRGQPQAISVFDEIVHQAAPAGPAFQLPAGLKRDVVSNQAERADRLVVIVVDDLHIYRGRTDRARDLVRQLIDRLGDRTTMALLFTSGEKSTQVTEDRADVLAAVDSLKGRHSVRRPNDANDRQAPGMTDPEDQAGREAAVAAAGSASLQDFFDNMSYYRTLQDAARILSRNDGRRKAFVLVSEGIGQNLSWLSGMQSPCDAGAVSGSTTSAPGDPCYHDEAALAMMNQMQRSNIVTYAIDPRGAVSSKDLLKECSPSPTGFADDPCSDGLTDFDGVLRLAQHGLEDTAASSGGFAVTNTDDFTGGLDRIISDLDNYYLLGFYASNTGSNGFRRLTVSVDRPGVTLRFRQGYELGETPAPSKYADPLTALVTAALPNPDIPLRVFAAPFPDRKGTRIAVAIEITEPRRDLQDADGRVADDVRYSVLAADSKSGKAVQQLANTAHLASPRALGASAPSSLVFQLPMSLLLKPGRYQIRASALSAKLGRGGSTYLALDVPDFSHDPVALSGLVLGYASGPKVPTSGASNAAGIPFEPSLDRDFKASDTLRLFFEIARRNPSIAATATIEFVDYTNRVVRTVNESVAGGASGVIDARLPLDTLTPGAYRLRVTATAGAATARREVGIVVGGATHE
jgi:VWFA-related protein